MGLPRSARLSRRDLSLASQSRRFRASSGPVSVQLCTTDPGSHPETRQQVRVGFAIGKPVGGAVVRNRVRRRLRVGVRPLLPQIAAGPRSGGGVTLVVVRVTPDAASLPTMELIGHLQRAVRRCLDRIAIVPGSSEVRS